MRKQVLITTLAGVLFALPVLGQKPAAGAAHGYPIDPVPFTAVKVEANSFWGARLDASRKVTIPLAFSKCQETGRYRNFVCAAHPSDTTKVGGLAFDDTDVYKTIEGASYSMQTFPDAKLDKYIDSVLVLVKAAQEPDGYLYTSRTMNPKHPHEWAGSKRWEKVEDLSHEFYDLGHMVEGAIAHYQATGKRTFLDIARGYADCVCREIGDGAGQVARVPGHQIAEMALAKLYLVTGDKKYLDQAKYFLDKRGYTERTDEYSQAHKPVVQQSEAVGHAVRASYMYAGMADVAALTGDTAYINAIDRIWGNIVGKKMYITGGIGSTSSGEAFGDNYELPNMSAYCETCAAIGNVYVNYRLFLLHGEGKYFDVLERSLYNGLISGVSMDGGGFFYPNPLQSMGQHQRQPWFGCACCPSNICRFIPSLPGYVYAEHKRNVYVNLFMPNSATLTVEGKKVGLKQTTNYPWEGDVTVEVTENKAGTWTLQVRVPGWVRGEVVPSDLYEFADDVRSSWSLDVNGQRQNVKLDKGYATVSRAWKKGDKVTLHLSMEPRVVRAHPKVEADRGRVCFERGPLVYCAEWPDNEVDPISVLLNQKPEISVKNRPDLLGGVVTLQTAAQSVSFDAAGKLAVKDATVTLIPYYAWCHRGPGNMTVYLAQQLNATKAQMPPSLASRSQVESSNDVPSLRSINDRLVPADEDDHTAPFYNWWPKQKSTEWIVYRLPSATKVSKSTVYWFDDRPWGGCRVPKWWKVYYEDEGGKWQEVAEPSGYPVKRGAPCTVHFNPVTTKALKLEIRQPDDNSAGLYEWEVE